MRWTANWRALSAGAISRRRPPAAHAVRIDDVQLYRFRKAQQNGRSENCADFKGANGCTESRARSRWPILVRLPSADGTASGKQAYSNCQ
jgi:hypothetical protein